MTGVRIPRNGSAGVSAGAYLRAEIERLGLDQVALAEATDVSRQTINNIVNGRQQISRAMATKLARLTGRSSDFWLKTRFPSLDTGRQNQSTPEEDDGDAADRSDDGGASILVNHQITRAVRDGAIVIQPFKDEHVRLASIDLTLDDFITVAASGTIDISGGKGFALQSGQTIGGCTKEWLEFPLDHVGRVGAMTRLTKFGVITSHGFQVDPGFSGQLQFCLFNAGTQPFELRSGEPIVSLEITRLTVPASPDNRGSAQLEAVDRHDDAPSRSDGDDSNSMIRDHLRKQVQTAPAGADVVARIPALDIEIFDHPKQAAIDSAVDFALGALDDIRGSAVTETDLGDRYQTFFDRAASDLHLSASHIHIVLVALGLNDSGAARSFVKLPDGSDIILQVPRGTGKISLKNLAAQLRLDAADLILQLTLGQAPRT